VRHVVVQNKRDAISLAQGSLGLHEIWFPARGSFLRITSGRVDSRARADLYFLKPGQGTVHIFCEHLSPGDKSARHPRPKYYVKWKEILVMPAQRFGERQSEPGTIYQYLRRLEDSEDK
jgi:hypothetical protein